MQQCNSEIRLACPVFILSLLQLLLGAQVVGVATLALSAVGRLRVQPGIALAADHLVAVVLLGQDAKTRFDHTTHQAQAQVKGATGLEATTGDKLVVGQLPGAKKQSLLVAGDACGPLHTMLQFCHTLLGTDVQGDGPAVQRLYKHLHPAEKRQKQCR